MILRYLLAFVLSVLVLVGWQMWMAPAPPRDGATKADPAARDDGKAGTPEAGVGPRKNEGVASGDNAGQADTGKPGTPESDRQEPVADSDLAIEWADGLTAIARLSVGKGEAARKVFDVGADGAGPLGLSIETVADTGAPPLLAKWVSSPLTGWSATAESKPGGPWIHTAKASGLQITRRVSVVPDAASATEGKTLSVRLSFENLTDKPSTFRYRLAGPTGLESRVAGATGSDFFVARGVQGTGSRLGVESLILSDVKTKHDSSWTLARPTVWVAAANGDSIAALWSVTAASGSRSPVAGSVITVGQQQRAGKMLDMPAASLESGVSSVIAKGSHNENFLLYLGPRDPSSLASNPSAAKKLRLADANQLDVEIAGESESRPGVRITVDSGTGSIAAIYLLEYRRDTGSEDSYRLILRPDEGPGFLEIEKRGAGADTEAWKTAWTVAVDKRADGRKELVLEKVVGSIRIRKRISAALGPDFNDLLAPDVVDLADGRVLLVTLELEHVGGGGGVERFPYNLYGPTGIATSSHRMPGMDLEFALGIHSESGRVLTQVEGIPSYDDEPAKRERFARKEDIAWIGAVNSYFTALMISLQVGSVTNAHAEGLPYPSEDPDLAELACVRTWTAGEVELRDGVPAEKLTFAVYLGPRMSEFIAQGDLLSLDGLNDYGWFSGLVHFFIGLLNTLGVEALGSGRWGWAIILLTLIVKLCLHPINRKTQRSMMRFQKKLQKIQPQMKEIQAKYANDKMKSSQETQKLWREHGVNPGQGMMSCLVMFLQLPIWISLYYSLEYAIPLRQAPFAYIIDLGRPDQLFELPFTLPFLGAHFNLLPILYVILTLANQRLQPRPTDPQMQSQQKMMTFMMIFFGFIFYSFPSGFMLYIMTSAALGILESKMIKAQLAKEDKAAPGAAAGTPATVVVAGGGPGVLPGSAPTNPRRGSHQAKGKKSGKSGKRRRG